MDVPQTLLFTILTVLFSIASYFLIPIIFSHKPENWRNAPPGPIGWPILGILPRITGRLHEDFFHLAKQYGPLMSVKMGLKPAIVISSPEMAYEALKVQDLTFSSRTITEAIKVGTYDATNVAFSPYGPHWILIRKMVVSEILSAKSLKAFESLRRKQVHGMLKQLYRVSLSNGSINIADSAFLALANQISILVASESLFDCTEKGSQIKAKFFEVFRVFGTPNISDLIPILKPFDPQGLRRKLVKFFSGIDAFYDELIDKRLEEKKNKTTTKADNDKMDLLDVLLQYRSEKKEDIYEKLPRKVIKAVINDMFLGGTTSSSNTIEWGMTEILKNPEVYHKIISELDQVVGKDRFVQETLLHAFEWKFPSEILNDSSEEFGLTLRKGVKLVGTAKPRLADSLYC
ncbi:hypothetical protein L6164_037079 [Bauhinia variegata]|uniref:Uncharacterized protein n=1 Tax=Bauhinia variegata TaxID=167791 RepID=A0ACB9KJ56_BAUVA|nr:hypothetical protein L6164_037079 [Bauhinia variegata]